MQKFNTKKSPHLYTYFFYSSWFLLAIWQSNYTDLLNDEAYYWKYSQFLDWGYFDHPPMVAFLIKIGSTIFFGEFGVRIFFVLLGTGTIFLIQCLISPTNKKLFYTIISSIGLLYFTSFLALPDIPLLFFTSAFFYLIKLYYQKKSIGISILIGIVTACILLSKYHGLVVVLLALISNIKLVKNRSFYVIVLTALALVLPHFFWQVNHDFPSIQYHFYDRNLNAYHISNTINYLLVQFLLFGPFIGIILWIGFFKASITNQLEKTLYWQVVGITIFFFVLTFNGKVQGHWTSISLIPLVYFGYFFLNQRHLFRKLTYYQWPISVLLILIVKLGLVVKLPSKPLNGVFEDFKGKEQWAMSVQNTVKDLPVAFMNSYQNAAIYEFYTRQPAITISNVMSRKNQYDLWKYEDSVRGKTVVIIPNYPVNNFDTLLGVKPTSHYTFIENFQHYGQVQITATDWKEKISMTDSAVVNLKLLNFEKFSFLENRDYPSYIAYTYFEDNHFISQHRTNLKLEDMHHGRASVLIKIPAKKSSYQVYFSIRTGWLPPSLNSKVYLLEIN